MRGYTQFSKGLETIVSRVAGTWSVLGKKLPRLPG